MPRLPDWALTEKQLNRRKWWYKFIWGKEAFYRRWPKEKIYRGVEIKVLFKTKQGDFTRFIIQEENCGPFGKYADWFMHHDYVFRDRICTFKELGFVYLDEFKTIPWHQVLSIELLSHKYYIRRCNSEGVIGPIEYTDELYKFKD